jgi:hypothetical protein
LNENHKYIFGHMAHGVWSQDTERKRCSENERCVFVCESGDDVVSGRAKFSLPRNMMFCVLYAFVCRVIE